MKQSVLGEKKDREEKTDRSQEPWLSWMPK